MVESPKKGGREKPEQSNRKKWEDKSGLRSRRVFLTIGKGYYKVLDEGGGFNTWQNISCGIVECLVMTGQEKKESGTELEGQFSESSRRKSRGSWGSKGRNLSSLL